MVRLIVVCVLCLALAPPVAAEETTSGVLEGLWSDLVSMVVGTLADEEEIAPATNLNGIVDPSTDASEEIYPSFIPNG